jgi:hypothetical protein
VSQEEAQGAAEQIIYQHPLAGGSPHSLKQQNRFLPRQMMQEQGAEDDIPLAVDLTGKHIALLEACASLLLP